MEVKIVPAYRNLAETRALFSEYTDMLVREDPAVKEYLEIQGYGQ